MKITPVQLRDIELIVNGIPIAEPDLVEFKEDGPRLKRKLSSQQLAQLMQHSALLDRMFPPKRKPSP